MANYPQELAQVAVCQSHTGHMTGLWFLPVLPLRLNTNEMIRGLVPDRPWGLPSLLYNAYRLPFPGIKRLGVVLTTHSTS